MDNKDKKRGLEARIRNIVEDYEDEYEDDKDVEAPVAEDEWSELLTEEHFPGRELPDGFPLTANRVSENKIGDLWGHHYRDNRFPPDSKNDDRYDVAYEHIYDTVHELRKIPRENRFTPEPPERHEREDSPEITRWPPLYIDGDSHKVPVPYRPATAYESLGDWDFGVGPEGQNGIPWPAPIEMFPDNEFRSKDYRDLYTRKATRRVSMSPQLSPNTKSDTSDASPGRELGEARPADTTGVTEGQIDPLDEVDAAGATEAQTDSLNGADTAGAVEAQNAVLNGADTAGASGPQIVDPSNGDPAQNQASPPNGSQSETANDTGLTQAVEPAKPKRTYRKRQPKARNAAAPVPTRTTLARSAKTNARRRIVAIAFAEEQESEDDESTRTTRGRSAKTNVKKRIASIAFAEEREPEDDEITARIKAAKANSFKAKRQAKGKKKATKKATKRARKN